MAAASNLIVAGDFQGPLACWIAPQSDPTK